MKKKYITPQTDCVDLMVEGSILAGSGENATTFKLNDASADQWSQKGGWSSDNWSGEE